MSSVANPPVEVIVSSLLQRRGQMEAIFDRMLTDFLERAGVKIAQFEAARKWDWGDGPAAGPEPAGDRI